MTDNKDCLELFKPQKLSNTAWGVATLLSKKREADLLNSNNFKMEDEDIIKI